MQVWTRVGTCTRGLIVWLSDYTVPWTRTKSGDSAFTVSGPVVWNSLPAAVHEADRLYSVKRKIETHLFTLCVND